MIFELQTYNFVTADVLTGIHKKIRYTMIDYSSRSQGKSKHNYKSFIIAILCIKRN